MASFFDPISPEQAADPMSMGIDPNTFAKTKQEWDSFLGNPQGQAALMSAGLALMQPPSFGDNGVSQIGRAIGAAGQSATANQATDMKQQELESKQDLRSSQATAAEARAATAGARAETAAARSGNAADRLAFQRERLEAMDRRNLLGNRVRVSVMYQNYVKEVAKANQNAQLLGGTQQPVLSHTDWIKQNPMLRQMGLIPPENAAGTEDDDTEIPATSPPTTSGGVQPAPRDAAARTPNTVYSTPKGNLKWTGTGWVSP